MSFGPSRTWTNPNDARFDSESLLAFSDVDLPFYEPQRFRDARDDDHDRDGDHDRRRQA